MCDLFPKELGGEAIVQSQLISLQFPELLEFWRSKKSKLKHFFDLFRSATNTVFNV